MKAPALIKEARLRAGLTQEELARRLDTTQSVIARWESGARSPSLETIEKVARACDLDISFSMAAHDDQLLQGLDLKDLSPGERIEYMVNAARNVDEMVSKAKRVG